MADNSFAWAATKGLLRTNEVHKTEEAKLVVEEKFSNITERGSTKELNSSVLVEDPCTKLSLRALEHFPTFTTLRLALQTI